MPDDFVLNVRQIGNYQGFDVAPADAMLLIQVGGLGGPYGRISPKDLVSTALMGAGVLVAKSASVVEFMAQCLNARRISADAVAAGTLTVGAVPVADQSQLGALNLQLNTALVAATASFTQQLQALAATSVRSLNGLRGDITLNVNDVIGAAPLFSPYFGGCPRADPPSPMANDGELATAAWVRGVIRVGAVNSFNGRAGAVALRLEDVVWAGGAPIRSPYFVGFPGAPTPPEADRSDRLATTAYVQHALDILAFTTPGPPGPEGPQGPQGTGFNFRGSVATMTALPPAGNEVGDLMIASDTNTGYVWSGTAWDPIGIISPSARCFRSDTEPLVAADGDLWWNSTTGELFVFYEGPSGDQWVVANTGLQGPQGPQGLQGIQGPPGANVAVGGTAGAPAAPDNGDLWFDSDSGLLMLWYEGPSGGQWVQVGGL